MHHNHVQPGSEISFDLLLALPFVYALILYIHAGVISNADHKRWPFYRYICWSAGVLCAAIAVIGPLAHHAHGNFTAHMIGHLLLGMLAPLLLALAAPMTLLLRTIGVKPARILSRWLKSWPVSFYHNPVIASILNIGGLYVLYTTNLYKVMQGNILLHVLVHLHVFLAGFLYTITFVYIDPVPHRYHYTFRAIVLVLSLAAHGILSKYIYAYPPAGVPIDQAETGAIIMYYGGDFIEVVLIWLLCYQWYKSSRPRNTIVNTPLNQESTAN